MQTIRRFEIPKQSGEFERRLPEHCNVLGIHHTSLVVLGVHDDERGVAMKFVSVFDDEDAGGLGSHRYLGSVTRDQGVRSVLEFRHQHVFQVSPL